MGSVVATMLLAGVVMLMIIYGVAKDFEAQEKEKKKDEDEEDV